MVSWSITIPRICNLPKTFSRTLHIYYRKREDKRKSGMDNRIFTNIMVETDGSELARKAVDSVNKLAQKTTPSFMLYM